MFYRNVSPFLVQDFGGQKVMISNDGKEIYRGIGLLAEHIICMAVSYEEPIEKFRKSPFYLPELEDKRNIIQDNIESSSRIKSELKLISASDSKILHEVYGIDMNEYADLLDNAVKNEPYENNEVKFKSDAIVSIVLDILHRELRDDAIYRNLAEGGEHENVQV